MCRWLHSVVHGMYNIWWKNLLTSAYSNDDSNNLFLLHDFRSLWYLMRLNHFSTSSIDSERIYVIDEMRYFSQVVYARKLKRKFEPTLNMFYVLSILIFILFNGVYSSCIYPAVIDWITHIIINLKKYTSHQVHDVPCSSSLCSKCILVFLL
jgi:hypothetical protein